MNLDPIILTLKLALVTTLVLLFIGLPIGYWLSHTRNRLKPVLLVLMGMPIVLPPTVLGFYLLLAFSPASTLGSWLNSTFGLQLAFSFQGLVLASVIYSLPFMVYPIQSGFKAQPHSLREASFILGKSKLETLLKVQIPGIKNSIFTAVTMTFAHTMGEFGVVMMIGGNIPGETRVASIAIYDEVEMLNFDQANTYSLILLVISFGILISAYYLNKSAFFRLK